MDYTWWTVRPYFYKLGIGMYINREKICKGVHHYIISVYLWLSKSITVCLFNVLIDYMYFACAPMSNFVTKMFSYQNNPFLFLSLLMRADIRDMSVPKLWIYLNCPAEGGGRKVLER